MNDWPSNADWPTTCHWTLVDYMFKRDVFGNPVANDPKIFTIEEEEFPPITYTYNPDLPPLYIFHVLEDSGEVELMQPLEFK